MARYEDEFIGIPGRPRPARGMDPNYHGAYRGMRMHADGGQAAYGGYRLTHPEDYGGSGGFQGRYRRGMMYTGEYESGYDAARGGESGIRPRYDRDLLRDFNANSPALRGYDRDLRPRGEDPFRHGRRNRFGYANRGLSSGGYSEGWAWGPMRGAR